MKKTSGMMPPPLLPRVMLTMALMLLSWSPSSVRFVSAGFGDYEDTTFECPAMTTCPQVCVPTSEDCPTEMRCTEPGEVLCQDGSCATFCDPDLVSPCDSPCAPVACPKFVTTYDVCLSNYTRHYEYAAFCESSSTTTTTTDDDGEGLTTTGPTFTWTDPAYIATYLWVGSVTFCIVLWCWYK